MAEYIERKTAIKAVEKADYTLIANDADDCKVDYLREIIESVPAADVVPVVRCKDCKHEYIERANLAERIKYYITHTTEDSGEHYAWYIALNEVLNCPTADVVSASQERIYKDLLDALFKDVRSLDTTLIDTCCMCSKGECDNCNLRTFEDELSAILRRAAERKKRVTD